MTRPNIPARLSFDSRGINDASRDYCPRLFTITPGRTNDPQAQALGHAFAAVPALLEAFENLFKRLQAIEVSKRWHEKPEEMDEAEFIRLISEEVAERGFLSEARSALIAAGYQF